MLALKNTFKTRLNSGTTQIGLWVALGDPSVAELASGAGFDWLLIDGEHGPNGLRDILAQLRAIGDKTPAIVRVRDDNRAEIKQVLDIGAQTLLVPMIESKAQAEEVVRSAKYPPQGVRGAGAALARASAFNSIPDYLTTANDQIAVIVQVESKAGIDALDEILGIDGLDGVFVGPSDLAADLGFLGQPGASEIRELVGNTLTKIKASGKAAGVLTPNRELALEYQALGVDFLGIGTDVGALQTALAQIRKPFT